MAQTFFIERTSGLHSLNPLTKLTITLALVVTAFAARWMFAPIALFVIVILPIAAWGKIAPQIIRTTVTIVIPFAVSLAIIQGLFYPGAQTVLVQIGPFSLKAEGLQFAFITTTRIMVIAGAGLLVLYSTIPADLTLSLEQHGAPPSLAYIAITVIQLLPEMQARASAIMNAQSARGMETQGSIPVRVRAFIPLIAPLIYGALEQVQERALALDARAFRSNRTKTSWRTLRDTPTQRILRIAMLLLTVIVVVISLFM